MHLLFFFSTKSAAKYRINGTNNYVYFTFHVNFTHRQIWIVMLDYALALTEVFYFS